MDLTQTFTGTICITRTHGGDESHSVRIVVRDEPSRSEVIDVRLSSEDFAHAIFGMAYRPCEYEIHSDPERWGMIRENKSVQIPRPERLYRKDEVRKYLEEQVVSYEVDGWKASISGALSTRQDHPTYLLVSFFRFVDSKGE